MLYVMISVTFISMMTIAISKKMIVHLNVDITSMLLISPFLILVSLGSMMVVTTM